MLGTAAGSLSLVMLVKLGFDFGFVAPLQLMLDYYQQAVEFLLGWAEPPLRFALQCVSDWIALDLNLHAHWKYVFILMWLYFGADAKIIWGKDRKGSAIATVIWGGLIALVASVASGTVKPDSPNTLSVIFPVTGFVVYEVGQSAWDATFFSPATNTWWQTFRYYLVRFALTNATIGVGAIFLGIQGNQLGLPNPYLVAVIVFLIALGIRNLARGAWIATSGRKKGERWLLRFHRSATARLGILLLATITGSVLFIALNAGLKMAGL